MTKISRDYSIYKERMRVVLKKARKNSTMGYANYAGRPLTITKILPQYAWAFECEECKDSIFRLKDIDHIIEN